MTQALRNASAGYEVDSDRLRARVLATTWTLAASGRVAIPQKARPARSARAVWARPRTLVDRRPTFAFATRSRLVMTGVLAAVIGVIAVSVIVTAPGGRDAPSVTASMPMMTAGPTSPAPPATSAGASSSASPSATASPATPPPATPSTAPAATGKPSAKPRPATTPAGQQPGAPRALRGSGTEPFYGQLTLPAFGTSDWVVFGSGHNGVTARASSFWGSNFTNIDPGRASSAGTPRSVSASVTWSMGAPPRPQGRTNEALRIPGGRPATLNVVRGYSSGHLMLYVMGTSRLHVTATARGSAPSSVTVPTRASGSVVGLDLAGTDFYSSTTVSVSADVGTSFVLVAAVLR